MIITGGFKGDNRVGVRFESFVEIIKSLCIHIKLTFTDNVHRAVNNRIIKLILRNINPDKVCKRFVFHVKPHLLYFLSPKSYLPFDSGFEAKSTNRDFWDGGQTPFEALKLRKYVVLCPLLFLNLVIYFSNIKYKYHNNS